MAMSTERTELSFLLQYSVQFYQLFQQSSQNSVSLGWWHGVTVTRFIRATKLLYARPGYYWNG